MPNSPEPLALTIAGLDPSGGAGMLADIRTFAAFGCRGAAVITSITFQNPDSFHGALHQSASAIRDQLEPILSWSGVAGVKTGMLPTREVIEEVARLFGESDLPSPVIDPVVVATSGAQLIEDDAVEVLVGRLFSLARVVTPNVPEAERLTGMQIKTDADMRHAAVRIRAMGARAVLVKGGHLTGENAIDVLDEDGRVTTFSEKRIPGVDVHGSGCVLSAAIAAGLGKGQTLEDAIHAAKRYLTDRVLKSAKRT